MAAKKKKTFEESLARLKEISSMLESGDLPLSESLELFEESAGLIKDCNKMLDEAEQKVTLLKIGPDNAPEEVPFDE